MMVFARFQMMLFTLFGVKTILRYITMIVDLQVKSIELLKWNMRNSFSVTKKDTTTENERSLL